MSRPHSRTWHWRFDRPVTAIWPLFADTARFNEAAGFPPYQVDEQVQSDGSVRFFARGKLGPYVLDWEEIPGNWQEGHWFTHQRRFRRGPFSRIDVLVRMEAAGDTSTCSYTLEVEPANLVGHLVLLTGFFRKTERAFSAMAERMRRFTQGAIDAPFAAAAPQLAAGAEARCAALALELAQTHWSHGLQQRLIDWVLQRQDNDLLTLRPKVLARHWQISERAATELCLVAASRGLLALRWDLLCPNCRIGKAPSTSMDELPQGAHCGTCNIDYQRDFNRNVELSFLPSKSIRVLQGGEYCLFGPMSTPHIKAQLRAEAGATRHETNTLRHGHYRIRTLERGDDVTLEWASGAFPGIIVYPNGRLQLGPPAASGALEIDNRSGLARTVIIEERAWMADVLTAKEAATLQCFRDLFSNQLLRPGDHVAIDNVVLLFTDIRASTALYNEIGDASAYALVREHFAILAACVRKHDGAVVKTIGDAIMAAFCEPRAATLCALAIQQAFAGFNAARRVADAQVVVKIGMHMGPCISVTLNGILDYYGKAVNLTARLAALAEGGDVVLSQTLAGDAAVAHELAALAVERGDSELKGFPGTVAWARVRPAMR